MTIISKARAAARDHAGTFSRTALALCLDLICQALASGGGGGAAAIAPNVAFVSPDGNDTSGEVGTAQPYLTIQAALTALATQTGAAVLEIAPGNYTAHSTGLQYLGTATSLFIQAAIPGTVQITGVNAAVPVLMLSGNSSTLLTYAKISGVALLPLAATGATVMTALGGTNANFLRNGLEIDRCFLQGDCTFTRTGPVTITKSQNNAPPDGSSIGTLTLRENGGESILADSTLRDIQIRHDYAALQSVETQGGIYMRNVKAKMVHIYESAIVHMDALCTVDGSAGVHVVGALATSGTHNPYLQIAAQVGSPIKAPEAQNVTVLSVTFSNTFALAEGWGVDMSGARLLGNVVITQAVILGTDPAQVIGRHIIGGTGVKLGGNLQLIGGASGGGHLEFIAAFRGADQTQARNGARNLTVNGFIALDIRWCALGDFAIQSFTNGATLDADRRVFLQAGVPGAVSFSPAYPSYVGTTYTIGAECDTIAAGDLSFATKTAGSFVATPEVAAATNILYTLSRPSV